MASLSSSASMPTSPGPHAELRNKKWMLRCQPSLPRGLPVFPQPEGGPRSFALFKQRRSCDDTDRTTTQSHRPGSVLFHTSRALADLAVSTCGPPPCRGDDELSRPL